MEKQFVFSVRYIGVLSGILVLFGLYLTSLYSYLLFHSLAEIFSIVIACGIFMLAWNSRRFMDNNYLLFIGIAYLFIGGMDLLHTLAYTGMGVFPGSNTNLPTQLWIAARYMESISLLIAPMVLGRELKIKLVFPGFAVAFFLLLGSIFYWSIFPDCFIEGAGLTVFKKGSEYVICLILLGSVALLFQKRGEFDARVLHFLIASVIVTICSELAFTFYVHAYDLSNLMGHFLKIISFYLIYMAIIVTGLKEPYYLLFRNLKRSEEALRNSEAGYRQLSKNLEENVKEKVAELKKAQSLAAIGQMVSVVAHEIRNPLQTIHMGIDTIRKEIGEDRSKAEILKEIDDGVNLLNGIVKELLEYSRPVNLEYTSWPVRDIVRWALNTLSDKLCNITVHLELEQEDREITLDVGKMVRVLVNLISNAAEAMPEGGNLKICSQFSEREGANILRLFISDNGCGVDEEDLDRIVEPFVTTKSQGTGLGIPICRKIIDGHNGTLNIRSKVNEGTTVEITLPIQSP